MTCPRCARDLLILARDALQRGDLDAAVQPIREAITEWEHPGEARALTGVLRRLEALREVPDIAYWLMVAERRLAGPLVSTAVTLDPARPCGACPGNTLL